MANAALHSPDVYTIDAVITWVDGNDPALASKRRAAIGKADAKKSNTLPTGKDKTRFQNNGELRYCLQSIRSFAPWIRTIWIITDNQKPDFLSEELAAEFRIRIVDHKDLFRGFDWALPTFNSRTIEMALWKIPGIAPRFLYFNDDFILTRTVTPDDFFREGKVVLRGGWQKMMSFSPTRRKIDNLLSMMLKSLFGITRSLNLLLQTRSAKLAGIEKKFFKVPHVPHPLITESQRAFFEAHPEVFEKNITYKFRNTDQVSGVYLGHHLEIASGNAITLSETGLQMINGELDFGFTIKKKLKRIERGEVDFSCLQGYEFLKPKSRNEIHRVLLGVFARAGKIHPALFPELAGMEKA